VSTPAFKVHVHCGMDGTLTIQLTRSATDTRDEFPLVRVRQRALLLVKMLILDILEDVVHPFQARIPEGVVELDSFELHGRNNNHPMGSSDVDRTEDFVK
jgi:hypothetical protein